ncbi:MAG: hypothetical protein ACLUW6_04895 [Coriobacteriaceae bacterium]
MVVLDEATAFADPENEALIQQALGCLAAGKTVLMIAHRLSTVDADLIAVVDDSAIVGGTHEELLAAAAPTRACGRTTARPPNGRSGRRLCVIVWPD